MPSAPAANACVSTKVRGKGEGGGDAREVVRIRHGWWGGWGIEKCHVRCGGV